MAGFAAIRDRVRAVAPRASPYGGGAGEFAEKDAGSLWIRWRRMTAAHKKMADEFAEIQVEKNAGFMLIIKEMKAKADADNTKMRKLENEKDDESKLHFKCDPAFFST